MEVSMASTFSLDLCFNSDSMADMVVWKRARD